MQLKDVRDEEDNASVLGTLAASIWTRWWRSAVTHQKRILISQNTKTAGASHAAARGEKSLERIGDSAIILVMQDSWLLRSVPRGPRSWAEQKRQFRALGVPAKVYEDTPALGPSSRQDRAHSPARWEDC